MNKVEIIVNENEFSYNLEAGISSLRTDSTAVPSSKYSKRSSRRILNHRKQQKKMKIYTYSEKPTIGKVATRENGEEGKDSFVKHPKTSKTQKAMKRQANKKVRRMKEYIPDGSHYKKSFNYEELLRESIKIAEQKKSA